MLRTDWKIYYNDLSTYTDASGVWSNAPASGILMVVESFDDGHKLAWMGRDYYYMDLTPSGAIGAYSEADKDDYSFLPESSIKTSGHADKSIFDIVHQDVFGV